MNQKNMLSLTAIEALYNQGHTINTGVAIALKIPGALSVDEWIATLTPIPEPELGVVRDGILSWVVDNNYPAGDKEDGDLARRLSRGDGWISVKERLPEQASGVARKHIVYSPQDGVRVVGEHSAIWNDSEILGERVTHWQPIPLPPTQDKEGV